MYSVYPRPTPQQRRQHSPGRFAAIKTKQEERDCIIAPHSLPRYNTTIRTKTEKGIKGGRRQCGWEMSSFSRGYFHCALIEHYTTKPILFIIWSRIWVVCTILSTLRIDMVGWVVVSYMCVSKVGTYVIKLHILKSVTWFSSNF